MYHYASGSDGAVVADCHAGEDADVCSDPYVVTYGDGTGYSSPALRRSVSNGCPAV